MDSLAGSRELVLQRVRDARSANSGAAADSTIPRNYERVGTQDRGAVITLFKERLVEYGATVSRVDAAALPRHLADVIAGAPVARVVIPEAVPQAWLTAKVEWLIDRELSAEEVETAEGVLTGASLAVASTGSIVLQCGDVVGRRLLTLLPDHYFCVIREDQIVETLPEAIEWASRKPTVPLTLISGPSATADIEMTRIKGVHGPRNLYVVLVGG